MPDLPLVDPRLCRIACDANALDRKGGSRDALVDRFRALAEAGTIAVVFAGGVLREMRHPQSPPLVRDAAPEAEARDQPLLFVRRPGLTPAQQINRMRVRAIVQGNARPGKHEADAAHLSEAAESGCAYFITYDGRLLHKRPDLKAALPGLNLVTLEDFFDIFDKGA